ncbi:gamma-glutamyltransferase [Tistrella mobilis]|uniref:Glutathione hydrolase proenzyme n=1 Tax=Tistrella mobilis TaxID=171437 RepID=A0A162K5S5_9PROT|nr:gamma-glutamyltransferase [Tistrella mobilis]KYO50524.1 gamma-glutamyltransferase [Tistrella mobilis]
MLARLRRSAAAGIAAALLASVLTGPVPTAPAFGQTTIPPAGPSMTDGRAAPEAATGRAASRGPVATRQMMVVAAHPLAVDAGRAVLEDGGSAADAAITVQLMLGLLEPQSSGIGGGAFVLYHDAAAGRLTTLDARETAPAAAGPDLFLTTDGSPMGFRDAVPGGRSVGVPGVPALLFALHERWGRLPLTRLFQPAIALAEAGVPVSPRLAGLLADPRASASLRKDPRAMAHFMPGGQPPAPGTLLPNPDYADTLRALLTDGAAAFYAGPIGADLVAAAAARADNPGRIAEADLAAYRVVERPPVCVPYHAHDVCGMGPPSSGGLAIGQIMGLLDRHPLDPKQGPLALTNIHLLAEASKLAFADRDRWVADPDHVPVPVAGLINPVYLDTRARTIEPGKALPVPAPAGLPPGAQTLALAADPGRHENGTSHLSIVDAAGNVVSMTTSVEGAFGSGVFVRGFLLNNQLTDFSFRPEIDGRPVINRVEPGKRPRSSMAPTIVYGPDDRPAIVAGSPGGSRIIGYVAQALTAMIDFDLDPQAAAELPHVLNRNGPTEIEAGTGAEALITGLGLLGDQTATAEMTSGLNLIRIRPDGTLLGGSDPRREGIAAGQ